MVMNKLFAAYLKLYPGKADDILDIIERVTNENPNAGENDLKELCEAALCNELN